MLRNFLLPQLQLVTGVEKSIKSLLKRDGTCYDWIQLRLLITYEQGSVKYDAVSTDLHFIESRIFGDSFLCKSQHFSI